MRALVTGGAGFLGSCLVDCLLAAGFRVDALDDLSQGRMDHLRKAIKNDRFRFHLGTVLDDRVVSSLVEEADVVFHLASLVGMRFILDAKARCLEVNAWGSYTVLRHCARNGTRCIVFSSSDVYGNGLAAPVSESHPLHPGEPGTARWFYAVAKICAERAAMMHYARNGLPVTVVRPFNATGPRQDAVSGMVVPVFVWQALHGEPMTVHGSGRQCRTFISSADLIQQVAGLAMDDNSVGKIVNVGGTEEYTVLDLALLVKEVLNSSSPIKEIPYAEVFGNGYKDVMYRRPDLGLLERLGHLRPLHPLRGVIAEVASSQRKDLLGVEAD